MTNKWIKHFAVLILILFLCQSCIGFPGNVEPTRLPAVTDVSPLPTSTKIPPTLTPIPPTPTPIKEVITSGNVQRLIATWGFEIPDDSFRAVAFSPDGLILAAGTGNNNESPDQKLRLFDMTTGEQFAESERLGSIIWDIVYTPTGSMIAVGQDNGIVQMRSLQDLSLIQQFYFPGPVNSLSISPEGTKLAAGVADNGDGTVYIIDLASGENLLSFWAHPYSVADMDFSPNGSMLATGAVDRAAKVWDSSTGELIQSLPQDGQGSAVAFSHDGGLLASGFCAKSENYVCQEGGVLLWSTTTWGLFKTLSGPGNWIEDLAFSNADDLVVGADRYEYLHFWQVSDGLILDSMRISSYGSYAIDMTKDGYYLGVGSAYGLTLLEIGH